MKVTYKFNKMAFPWLKDQTSSLLCHCVDSGSATKAVETHKSVHGFAYSYEILDDNEEVLYTL